MNSDLTRFDLCQKSRDVFVILALRLGKLRILSHTLDTLPATNLDAIGSDAGILRGIRLTTGKG